MPPTPTPPGSASPSAVWNAAIREFLRSRHGRSLSTVERAEYERLRHGFTEAWKAEAGRAA